MGYSLIGLGVVGLGLGAVMGGLTIGKKAEVQGCMDDRACAPQTGRDAESAGRTFGAVSTVGFVAGAAVAVGGVVLVLTVPSERGGKPTATVAPIALPGGGGAGITGHF